MNLHIHIHHHHDGEFTDIRQALVDIKESIMTTQAELTTQITALKEQNDKARAEVLQRIADLEAALPQDVSPELQAAFDSLKASVQADDDIVPGPAV